MENRGGNVVDSEGKQQTDARAQANKSGHIVGATFVASGIGFEFEFDGIEVASVDHAVPADANRCESFEPTRVNISDARAFRAQ
jgi:hypothetical protein